MTKLNFMFEHNRDSTTVLSLRVLWDQYQ